jgi:hypothetical protein
LPKIRVKEIFSDTSVMLLEETGLLKTMETASNWNFRISEAEIMRMSKSDISYNVNSKMF